MTFVISTNALTFDVDLQISSKTRDIKDTIPSLFSSTRFISIMQKRIKQLRATHKKTEQLLEATVMISLFERGIFVNWRYVGY